MCIYIYVHIISSLKTVGRLMMISNDILEYPVFKQVHMDVGSPQKEL